jgi:hypothetical protein
LRANQIHSSSCIFFLDFHGVVDLFDEKVRLLPSRKDIFEENTNPICVLTFVGSKTKRHTETIQKLQKRIEKKQIGAAFCVFQRSDQDVKQIGTKAWVIKQILTNSQKDEGSHSNSIFVDDSEDHLSLVEKYSIKNVTTVCIDKKGPLLQKQKTILSILHKTMGVTSPPHPSVL